MKCANRCNNEGTQPHRDLPGLYCVPCGRLINDANGVDLVDLKSRDGVHEYDRAAVAHAQSGVPSPRDVPPKVAIEEAISVALRSPCQKSKRGVVVYLNTPEAPRWTRIVGVGFNGQPDGACTGTQACRVQCNKICVHAEVRAIRDACASGACTRARPSEPKLKGYSAVHVKLDDRGQLVAGGKPSCWQCAREVADVELDAFWLYEVRPAPSKGVWVPYTAKAFLQATLEACGIVE